MLISIPLLESCIIVNGFLLIMSMYRIISDPEFRLKHYFPVGDTESEYAFYYIMDNLRELGLGTKNVVEVSKNVWGLANKISDYGKFNFLLSNGEYLFAYMNKPRTLHYPLRHSLHRGKVRRNHVARRVGNSNIYKAFN